MRASAVFCRRVEQREEQRDRRDEQRRSEREHAGGRRRSRVNTSAACRPSVTQEPLRDALSPGWVIAKNSSAATDGREHESRRTRTTEE